MKAKRLNTLCYGLFLGLSACFIPTTGNAATAPASNDELPVAEIEKFFGNYLKVGEGTFDSALTIEADKVDEIINSRVPVAETVIVGDVPSAYYDIKK